MSFFERRSRDGRKGHYHDKARQGVRDALIKWMTDNADSEPCKQQGDAGIIHKSWGKESKRKLPNNQMERVVYLYQQRCQVFGPILFCEMRLKGITSLQEANKFLRTFLPKYNQNFSLKAQNPEDLHIGLTFVLKLLLAKI